MERIRSNTVQLKVHVENDHLIMHGSPNESAGCVLRGVLDVHVKEPIKVKSIHLRFSGRMVITWTERKSYTCSCRLFLFFFEASHTSLIIHSDW